MAKMREDSAAVLSGKKISGAQTEGQPYPGGLLTFSKGQGAETIYELRQETHSGPTVRMWYMF